MTESEVRTAGDRLTNMVAALKLVVGETHITDLQQLRADIDGVEKAAQGFVDEVVRAISNGPK